VPLAGIVDVGRVWARPKELTTFSAADELLGSLEKIIAEDFESLADIWGSWSAI
jgi:hypothetical protein